MALDLLLFDDILRAAGSGSSSVNRLERYAHCYYAYLIPTLQIKKVH